MYFANFGFTRFKGRCNEYALRDTTLIIFPANVWVRSPHGFSELQIYSDNYGKEIYKMRGNSYVNHPIIFRLSSDIFPRIAFFNKNRKAGPGHHRAVAARNIKCDILSRKANWICRIIRRNCLLHYTIEGKMREVKGSDKEEGHRSLIIWET